MDELVTLVLKTYGLAGVILLTPTLLLMLAVKENRRLHDAVTKAQEQRVADAHAQSTVMISLVREQTKLTSENVTLLEGLSGQFERFIERQARR